MGKVAVLFATRYGQSRKIADRIANGLKKDGTSVEVFDLAAGAPKRLDAYDAFVIGGPVYVGRFLPELTRWCSQHSEELASLPVAVFSVSLNAADTRPEARKADLDILDRFCLEARLAPCLRRSLKGALPYTRYGPLRRWLLRRISVAASGPSDTSRDYEMTDWAEVDAFALACSQAFPPSQPERIAVAQTVDTERTSCREPASRGS